MKPNPCPSCSSKDVAKILYGMPALTERLHRNMEEKRIVLGGCCVVDGQPEWYGNECEYEWKHMTQGGE